MNAQQTLDINTAKKTKSIIRPLTGDEASIKAATLMHKSKPALQSTCVALQLQADEFEGLTKPQLIQLIVSRSLKTEFVAI